MTRWVSSSVRAAAWAVFVLCFGYPLLALIQRCVRDGVGAGGSPLPSGRQWGLLAYSLALSATASVGCLIVSLPVAFVLGRAGGAGRRSVLAAILLCILLCPPMVSVFGWDRLLPLWMDPHLRCVGSWSLWAFPIPALILSGGWSRGGRRAYEAALLSTTPVSAFLRAATPALWRYVALSGFTTFVLFFGDYGVPHACGLLVYATELLGWASNSMRVADVLLPAWPGVLVAVALLAAVAACWRRCAKDDPDPGPRSVRGSRVMRLGAMAGVVAAFIVPVLGLIFRVPSFDAFERTARTYGMDVLVFCGFSLLAGVVGVVLGVGMVRGRFSRSLAVAVSIVFGAMPGALIGSALIAAYNRPIVGWVYDHWPIVILGYVARFGWIGVLTAVAVAGMRSSEIGDQAQVDGVEGGEVFRRVLAPMHWPVFAAAAAVIAALSLAEVPTTTLVRVPGLGPVSLTLIEKFHKMEDGMLVALSFCLMGAALPAGACVFWVLRRRG